MGLKYRTFLEGSSVYGCSNCKTHLSTSDAVLSRQFIGQFGQAYLFDSVYVLIHVLFEAPEKVCTRRVNVVEGKAEDRKMATGVHTVKDISCVRCKTLLGWIYIRAHDQENKYKEGKCILERKLLANIVC